MAQDSIPVDLSNPGQVFACLGVLELADVLLGNAEGAFSWEMNEMFIVSARGSARPIEAVLTFLRGAEVRWLSPRENLKERDGGFTEVIPSESTSPTPKSPDLPGVVRGTYGTAVHKFAFGFWADGSGRFATTFKKSTFRNSSHVRLSNALDALRRLDLIRASEDPLNQSGRTESLFRLDPRGNVDPIHGGFSPDTARKGGFDVRVATYPLCELLAIFGLQNARPERLDARHFAYTVWDLKLPPMLARAAIGGGIEFGKRRRFIVEHVEVTQMGDRTMTRITEELRQ